jgi:hypothetical protein
MPGSELADQRRQHPDRERANGGGLQLATLKRLRLTRGQPGALGGGQHGACLGEDLATGAGQTHAARCAFEQRRADVALERLASATATKYETCRTVTSANL